MTPAFRLVAVGLGALTLLVVVALASRGGIGGGSGGGGTPSSSLLDYSFTIFLVAYLAAIPIAAWAFFVQGRESRIRRAASGGRGRSLLTQLVVLVLIAGLAATILAQHRAHGNPPVAQLPALSGELPKKKQQPQQAVEPHFRWTVVVVLVGLGAAGAAVLLLRRRRGTLDPLRELAAELGDALDDAIDAVRAETGPRRAVLKAYARMEEILAAHGLPRREAEAPYEYLARTLGRVVASARGVERLTELYERARFSPHAIDPAMREEAIAALEAMRDELRAAAA